MVTTSHLFKAAAIVVRAAYFRATRVGNPGTDGTFPHFFHSRNQTWPACVPLPLLSAARLSGAPVDAGLHLPKNAGRILRPAVFLYACTDESRQSPTAFPHPPSTLSSSRWTSGVSRRSTPAQQALVDRCSALPHWTRATTLPGSPIRPAPRSI